MPLIRHYIFTAAKLLIPCFSGSSWRK